MGVELLESSGHGRVEGASVKYADNPILRGLVQLVPLGIGSGTYQSYDPHGYPVSDIFYIWDLGCRDESGST